MSWSRADWNTRVVEHLRDCKRRGLGFEDAWVTAMRMHPPSGSDWGPERPTLFGIDGDVSLVAFFKRACEDAWFGRRPALQHFHPSLLIEQDGTGPAVRARKLAA